MTKRINKQATSAWLNPKLSPASLKIINALPHADTLAEEIGAVVAVYRLERDFRDTAPKTSDSIRHLDRVADSIGELLTQIDLVPVEFSAFADLDLCHMGRDGSHTMTKRIQEDLSVYKMLCRRASKRISARPSKAGEKRKLLERKLLSDVTRVIESTADLRKIEAAGKAADVLLRSGIHHVPVEPKKARQAVIEYRKTYEK